MANPQRLRRIADQIQRELSDILRNELKDPRVGMITLNGFEVSPDVAHARVFFTTLGDAEALAATEAGLARAAGFVRTALGRRLKIHNIPELHFECDASVERGGRLSKLIDDAVAHKKTGERGRPARDLDGVLRLDKPSGIGWNAALQTARRVLSARRAGHTGTLDPMASGLRVLCIGEGTKFAGA